MNIMRGLYFPGITPDKAFFCSLLCLLDKVDFYRVVEQEEDASRKDDGSAYWEGHVVLPLGEDRDRFLAMVRDIKNHAADFRGGYLAALANEALGGRGESAVWQLVANLHGKNRQTDHDHVLTEKLWQARLVLKLAEMLAVERAEIAEALTEYGRMEQAVFSALKGELDDSDEGEEVFLTNAVNTGDSQGGAQVRHLMKAWSALAVMDPQKHSFMVTDSELAASILFDAWQEVSSGPPQLLLELELPAIETIAAMERIRKELAEAGTAARKALQDIVEKDPTVATANLKKAAGLWQRKVAAREGRTGYLDIYLLRGQSLKTVWEKISGVPAPGDSAGTRQNLVGVLRPAG